MRLRMSKKSSTFATEKVYGTIISTNRQTEMETTKDARYGFIYRMPDGELYPREGRDDDGLYTSYIFRETFDDDPKDAQYALGVLNCVGIGPNEDAKIDMERGVQYFFKAAQRRHPIAEYNVYIAASNGYFCNKDMHLAMQMLQQAIEDGCPEAKEAYDAMHSSASEASPQEPEEQDFYILGMKYLGGIGVPKDEELAFLCFNRAGNQGIPCAIAMLGVCYKNGIGCERDENAAMLCFKHAYEKGESDYAPAELAHSYLHGLGTEADYDKASLYAMKAVKSTLNTCQAKGYLVLACCYYWGVGGFSKNGYFAASNCRKALECDPHNAEAAALYQKINGGK